MPELLSCIDYEEVRRHYEQTIRHWIQVTTGSYKASSESTQQTAAKDLNDALAKLFLHREFCPVCQEEKRMYGRRS